MPKTNWMKRERHHNHTPLALRLATFTFLLVSTSVAATPAMADSVTETHTFTGQFHWESTVATSRRFWVSIPSWGSASLGWNSSQHNLDLYIKDPSGVVVAKAAGSNKPEKLSFEVAVSGWWKLIVKPKAVSIDNPEKEWYRYKATVSLEPKDGTVLDASGCLARPSIDVLPSSGTYTKESYTDNHTFDARLHLNTSYPTDSGSSYPINLGTKSSGMVPCWVGGVFIGQQSRSLTWDEVKELGGGTMTFRTKGKGIVDGLQADNHHDGINLRSAAPEDPTSGDGWIFRNSYMKYIRDDCIENDDMSSGTVYDVLFDGCFVGFSAARDKIQPDQSNEFIVFDHVLIRMQEMPGPPQGGAMGHGELLKWHDYAPRPVIRDSIILVEGKKPNWPPGTVIENSTLVWTYEGSAPPPYPGLTITTNKAVWDEARQDWLLRHGCTGFGSCSQISSPTPP